MSLSLTGLSQPVRAAPGQQAPDQGGVGIQLLDAPAERRADPRARRYIVDHLPPGAVIHRKLRIINQSAYRRHIEVYPGAAAVERGLFGFGSGRAANELTTWITLDRGRLDLPPHAETAVVVTIRVPRLASAAERYAVIWASVGSERTVAGNIAHVHRTGVRVYLNVGAGGEPPTDFAVRELVAARTPAGEPTLGLRVENTGRRALDLTGNVSLAEGPAGMRAGPFGVTEGTTLAVGQSGSVTVRFPPELPNGPWKIQATLVSGLEKRSVSGTVSFPAAGAPTVTGTVGSRAGYWWLAAGLVLLVIVLVLARVIRRARSARA